MIDGTRVRLRAYTKSYFAKFLEYLDFETIKLYRGELPLPPPLDYEAKWAAEEYKPNSQYDWAIETIDGAHYIGGCGYARIDWPSRVAEINIFIGKPWRTQGYGREAVGLLLDFMFKQMNLNKVFLKTWTFNPAAVRCYERCGFVHEGRLRQQIFRDGDYHDQIVMGLLRQEWLSA
jgi:RimJ/RimL family protein N-acetyltransferase